MDAGRPLCLLPVTLLGRFQHHCLVTMDGPGAAGVAGLAGKRVGVRSWSQTTGVWVRGIMSDDHGLDVSQVEWVVYEGARWYVRTGAIPLNHMVAATDSFVTANPGLVRELCGVLAGAVPATPRISSSPDFYPSGFDAVAPSLDLIGRYAFEQGVTSRVITAAEIRAKTERLSGLELGRLNAGGS
jgi:4,5-dihydroxyphthalate decarboxylase